jgi:nucleotide-binding universal stress UspA family protein
MDTTVPANSTRVLLNDVLFATDFSSAAHAALPYALAISRHYGSTLHAVHVIPELDILLRPKPTGSKNYEAALADETRIALEKIRDLVPELNNMPSDVQVRRGKVWDAISQIILENCIDLVVVGTQGRTGVGKLLMGSVAEEILRKSPCPVLTVGPKARGRVKEEIDETGKNIRLAEIQFKQIIFATDFTSESLAAASLVISFAEEFEARLGLLHVIDPLRPTPSKLVLDMLGDVVPQEAELWCTAECIVKYGNPAEEILRTASELNADLVVLGVRAPKAHLGMATHFPWSTAHRVITGSSCPVLTVRK